PLFERSVRGVQATAEGKALLPRARAIRTQLRQADEDIRQLRGAREGKLSVALSHFAIIALLPRVIGPFRKRWPGVQIAFVPPTFALEGLREGQPDFAVMSMPSRKLGSDYVARPLYATQVALVARPEHPLLKANSLPQLTKAEWVLPSLDSSVTRGLAKSFRSARLPPLSCAMTCQTLTGLETLVRETDLLGAMPLEVYEARKSASGLKRIPLREPIECPRVALLRWADGKPTAAAADMELAFLQAAHALATQNLRGSGTSIAP
ncbi:MAG: LysR family transcriptional regulator, partial [Rhodoferax sp.]|nr:LysR family transcriptional regulator [Rhodoferax sp.]